MLSMNFSQTDDFSRETRYRNTMNIVTLSASDPEILIRVCEAIFVLSPGAEEPLGGEDQEIICHNPTCSHLLKSLNVYGVRMKIKLIIALLLVVGFLQATSIAELIDQTKSMPDSTAVEQLIIAREIAQKDKDIEAEIMVLRALFDRYNQLGARQKAIEAIDDTFKLYRIKNERLNEENQMKYMKVRIAIVAGISFFILLIVTLVVILMRRNKQHQGHQKEIEKANRKLNETIAKLEAIAPHDAITGLPTKNSMIERIKYEEIRYERNRIDFTFIVCEIDDFDDIRTEHGMPTAEYVLKAIAEMIRDSIRKQDIVSRWGGERFLMLLPQTNPRGATVVAEKIRSRIESNSYDYREGNLSVTLTFGISGFDPEKGTDISIAEAEKALVQGKTQGMNQVVVYVPPKA